MSETTTAHAVCNLTLPRKLGALAKIPLKDAGYRYHATSNVHVVVGDGTLRAEVTDCKCAIVVKGPAPEGAPATEALVPAADWKAGFALSKRGAAVDVELNGKATMASGGSTRTAQFGEGRFPAIDMVIPKGEPVVKVLVDAKRLAALLSVLADLGATNGDDISSVELAIYPKNAPVRLTGRTDDGYTLDALLMPLS